MNLIQAAIDYLTKGLSVIALSGKMPNTAIHKHWREDALKPEDIDVIEASDSVPYAFGHKDTTGIGILTTYPYFVVDIDGEAGAEQWMAIAGPDWLPDRWVALTKSGMHLWFADTTPRASRKLGPKLDFKAEGGYVAAPPSLHPSGHVYSWMLPPDGAPMEAPASLRKLLDEQDWDRERRIVDKEQNRRVRHKQFTDGKWWATWGFDGIIDKVRVAPEGNRNAVLYWAAYTMTEDDADNEDYEQLREAAVKAGLNRREVRATIRSAVRACGG